MSGERLLRWAGDDGGHSEAEALKIVFLLTRADVVGGVQVHVRDLCSALLADGHLPTVLVGGTGPFTDELGNKRVPTISLRHLRRPLRFPIRPVRDGLALREIGHALRRLNPDIVSTHSAKAGWLGRIAAHRLGIPVLFTAHGWAFTQGVTPLAAAVYRVAERAVGTLPARVITVSDFDRELAIRQRVVAPDRMVTVHNGVCDVPDSLRASPGVDPPELISVARFERQKDQPTLLRALAHLHDQPWSLTLVGEGPKLAEGKKLAHSLGLSDRVAFIGARYDVAECLARAQVFALASRWEGLPRSIIEAMRAGLPAVATDVGGVREAVSEGETGYLTPRGDDRSMGERLRQLIEDPALRASMGQRARVRYEEGFTFARMYERTLALYHAVLGES